MGTGPFKLVDFQRDTFIKYERNNDYWRKGLPLLDGMEVRYVPDPVTASMMMETKEADAWMEPTNMKKIVDLEKKGFKFNWGPGMLWALLPSNAKDPKSPYANKKVREAMEYAIDRPAIAKVLGFGKYEPLTQIVPSFSPVYNQNYNPRPYNPEKAKQLLAEAGYPNGFDTKLLVRDTDRDAAIAMQTYLGAVGIRVSVDVADMGRYFAALYSPAGWTDLALSNSGINPDGTDLFSHFGPRPMTYRFGFIAKSPEFLAAVRKGLEDVRTCRLEGGDAAGCQTGQRGRHGYSPVEIRPGQRSAKQCAQRLHQSTQRDLVFLSGLDGKAAVTERRHVRRSDPRLRKSRHGRCIQLEWLK